MPKFNTEARITAAFACALILLIAVAAESFYSTNQLVDTGAWVSHTHEVVGELEYLKFSLKNAESAQRGFSLVPDERHKQAFTNARQETARVVSRIRALTSDNAYQQTTLTSLEVLIATYFDNLESAMFAPDLRGAAPDLVQRLYEKVASMLTHEKNLLHVRNATADTWISATRFIVGGAGTLAVVILSVALVLLNRDMHARKRAESAQRASEERVRSILNSTGEGIYGTDKKGICIFCNPVCVQLLGYSSANDLLGKSTHELLHYARADGSNYPIEECKIFLAFDKSESVVVTDEVFWRADKTSFPVEYRACALMEQGKAIGAVVTFVDITNRKRDELAMAQARDAAMESARLKSEFLANMSHEIRTPLNGVIGMSELLISSSLAGRELEYARTIRNSALSLMTILNDILDISKIEAGKLSLESIDINLQTIVEDIGMLIAARAWEKKLELIVRYAPDAPKMFMGDPVRIRQILSNLATNAIKFTKSGHVLLAGRMLSRENGRATMCLTVEDTGIGIDAEFTARLFEKFSQADASTTRQFGGTGLGLAISKNLVEMMGGQINVTSTPGKGTVFTITLMLPESSAPPAPAAIGDETLLKGIRSLIVDDNEVNRFVLEEQFAGWGIPHKSVESGELALAELHAAAKAGEPYSLIVLDYQMPRMNGEMLAERVRADPGLAGIRMVLLSSIGESFNRAKLSKLGISAMLHKPIRQSELFETLVKVWRDQSQGLAPLSGAHARVEPRAPAASLGLRLLIVDDNEVNRSVMMAMLQKLDCTFELAVNGSEAIECFMKERFDGILMDCQMPVMDGYTATREIRRLELENEAANAVRIPIIAMTANAMKGDREKCLDSGMDDYVSKPIGMNTLNDALTRIGKRTETPMTTGRENPSPAPNLPDFDYDTAMKLMADDLELLKEILVLFNSEAPKRMQSMRASLASGDIPTAERDAHSLKGSAGSIGAARVRSIAHAIEVACKDGNTGKAGDLLDPLEQALHDLDTAAKETLARI